MKRSYKYIKVKDGNISLLETNNFKEIIKETYGNYYNYDSSDFIFDENPNIRVFTKESSTFSDLEDTIYLYLDNKLQEVLKGTVLFAKNGKNNWKSLSKKDIDLINKKLIPASNNTLKIFKIIYQFSQRNINK